MTLRRSHLAAAIAGVVLLAPATALATHVFDDVEDDRFYAEPVHWAADNNITTGKAPDRFAPDDAVTRGESVTFLKRYHDNIVDPAVTEVREQIAATGDRLDRIEDDVLALRYISLPPSAFVPTRHDAAHRYFGGLGGLLTTGEAVAPIVLPSEAELVSITVMIDDNDAGAAANTFALRTELSSGAVELVTSSEQSGGAPSPEPVTLLAISSRSTIDAQDFTYELLVSNLGPDIRLLGAVVTYVGR